MSTVLAIGLLICSNCFMTLAWYGHLKWFKPDSHSMIFIILVSWGIAFLEYCFQVPANRVGYTHLSATQLKVIQEMISISVFVIFAARVLGEPLRWNHAVAFGFIVLAVYFAVGFK